VLELCWLHFKFRHILERLDDRAIKSQELGDDRLDPHRNNNIEYKSIYMLLFDAKVKVLISRVLRLLTSG